MAEQTPDGYPMAPYWDARRRLAAEKKERELAETSLPLSATRYEYELGINEPSIAAFPHLNSLYHAQGPYYVQNANPQPIDGRVVYNKWLKDAQESIVVTREEEQDGAGSMASRPDFLGLNPAANARRPPGIQCSAFSSAFPAIQCGGPFAAGYQTSQPFQPFPMQQSYPGGLPIASSSSNPAGQFPMYSSPNSFTPMLPQPPAFGASQAIQAAPAKHFATRLHSSSGRAYTPAEIDDQIPKYTHKEIRAFGLDNFPQEVHDVLKAPGQACQKADCTKKHKSHWPLSGYIYIEKCAERCEICGEAFTATSSVRRHVRVMHLLSNTGNMDHAKVYIDVLRASTKQPYNRSGTTALPRRRGNAVDDDGDSDEEDD